MAKYLRALALGVVVTLLASISVPAQAQQYQVVQRTLAPFAGGVTSLTAQQKQQIKDVVQANPDAEKFICTGIRFVSDPTSVNITVRSRAKQACEYAKQLNPNLSTWFQNKPTSARSYAGKVLLTLKTATQAVTFESYSAAKVSALAFNSTNKVALSKPLPSTELIKIVSAPNVTAEQVRLERSRLENSLRFWSASIDQPFTAYLYTGKDADWMVEKLQALGNNVWPALVKNSYWQQTGKCSQSAAAIVPGSLYLIHCIPENQAAINTSHILAHEYAHIPLMTNAQNQASGIQSELPVWLNEGAAEYFGVALTNLAKDPNMKYWHDLHIHGSSQTIKLSTRPQSLTLSQLLPTITATETVELFTRLEDQSALTSTIPYSVGSWATEVLVAVKGADAYLKFLDTMGPTKDWRAAFEEVFDISVTDFYKKMTPYLNWLGNNFPA